MPVCILVVGAGIAGLGAARALRHCGFAADVVERDPAWAPTGAGIYLPGNAVRALRALGLDAAVAERAALIPHQRLCEHRGNLLAEIDTAALWGDVGPCHALHRADLHEVPWRSRAGPDGCIAAGAQPAGQHRRRRVRRRQRRPLRPGPRRRRHPLPGPPARARCRRGPASGAGRLALRHRVPAGGDHVDGAAVLLVGDAAHATSPNMAEGAAMALEDGLVLAECLASGRGIAQTVATFQVRRRSRTQWVLAQTPPRSHPQPATRPPQPHTAPMGTQHLPRQLPPASRTPLMMGT